MTILYTESFKLDITHLNILFSEENSFFEKDLIKQQSFPFKIPMERSYIPFFEFVGSHNSLKSNTYITCTLFHNDRFFDAELFIIAIHKDIECIIYYNFLKIPLFEKKLTELPFETIQTGEMYQFALDTIAKAQDQSPINFVQVYHPEKYDSGDYPGYKGYINRKNQYGFVRPAFLGQGFVQELQNKVGNMNELRPFLYIKKLITYVFSLIDYTVHGDFSTDSDIDKALLYHDNSIFYTNQDFALEGDVDGMLHSIHFDYNVYDFQIPMTEKGYYQLNLTLEGDFENANEQIYISALFNPVNQYDTIWHSEAGAARNNSAPDSFNLETNSIFEVKEDEVGDNLIIRIRAKSNTHTSAIKKFILQGTPVPLYKEEIALGDLVPDITVGDLLNMISTSFNLHTTIDTSHRTLVLNFFENFYENEQPVNLSRYSSKNPRRTFSKKSGYSLQFKDDSILNIDKNGQFQNSGLGYEPINLELQPLPIDYLPLENEYDFRAKHIEAPAIVFYKPEQNAKALFIDGDFSTDQQGFIHRFLRKWYYLLLNAEVCQEDVFIPIYKSVVMRIGVKVFMHNTLFLIKKLRKSSVGSSFERISMELLKLKSIPEFENHPEHYDDTEGIGNLD